MSSKFKSIAIKVGLVVAGLLLFYFLFLYFGNYSTGTRGGIVMKISKKGYLFKTYEGQLDVGAINEPWSFSVEGGKEEVIEALDEAQQSGERVQLHYAEKYRTFFWRGDTKYFITKVTRQPPK